MTPPTNRQLTALKCVAKGLSMRGACRAMDLTSTNAIFEFYEALVAKGLLAKRSEKGNFTRYVPTAAGWAALGLQTCGNCKGTGTVNATTTKARG